jgi:hypothetical protein
MNAAKFPMGKARASELTALPVLPASGQRTTAA